MSKTSMSEAVVTLLITAGLLSGAAPAHATLKLQKEAKVAGFPAVNCLYCHNEKLPVKAKVTHNERGDFLIHTKAEKKAKEINVAWLKEFVETKK